MFTLPKENIIESTDGFSVEVLGRTGVLYREGERSVRIDSEILAGPSGLVIYSDSLREWLASGQSLVLDEKDRQRILSNVKAAFAFRGYHIEVN